MNHIYPKEPMNRIYNHVSVAVALAILWYAAYQVHLISVHTATIKSMGPVFDRKASILYAGVGPYLVACTLLEIMALFVPRLSRLRMGGAPGRQTLRRVALWLAVLFSLMFALPTSLFWHRLAGHQPAVIGGASFPMTLLLSTTTYWAVTYLLLRQFTWNHRWGLGHGFSLWVLVSAVVTTTWDLEILEKVFHQTDLTQSGLFLVAVLVLMVLAETRGPVRGANGKSLPLRWTPAGIIPAVCSTGLVGGYRGLLGQMYPLPAYVEPVLFVCFYLAFAWLFHPTRRLAGYSGDVSAREIGFALTKASLAGAAYLGAVVFGLPWLARLWQLHFPNPLLLLAVAAIGLDFFRETRVLFTHELHPVYVFHDVACAEAARQCLAAADLPCVFRGFHHRGLLYFLGPYLDITLLAPPAHADKATALLKAHFGDTDNAWLHPATP